MPKLSNLHLTTIAAYFEGVEPLPDHARCAAGEKEAIATHLIQLRLN